MKMLITCLLVFSAISMQAQESIAGIWNTGKDNTKIEITKEDGAYVGKIQSSDNAKAETGTLMLKEVKAVAGEWKGKLYSPKKGKWYDAVLKEAEGQLLITVKAGLMTSTVEWKKV